MHVHVVCALLDNYASDDAMGQNDFTAGGEWNFGVQMETWF